MVAVPDTHLLSVCFLCVDETDDEGITKPVPKATGFWVRVPLDSSPAASVDYLVTARHCIEEARQSKTIYIRFNSAVGDFIEISTGVDDWFTHDSADVAAIRVGPESLPAGIKKSDVDAASIKLDSFVGPGPTYQWEGTIPNIGPKTIRPLPGYEIYFVGLFTAHYGKERNLPVARFGHVSRLPSKMQLESAGSQVEIEAYLAEFHSWGGHSGSPVFYLHPLMIRSELVDEREQTVGWDFDHAHITGFLGLVSGHYDLPSTTETKEVGDIRIKMNSGVAIITPASAVRELLEREDLVAERQRLKEEIESRKPMPNTDSEEDEA